MQRYSVITEKSPREIVLLRGHGCRYKLCAFCDYHEDASDDEQANLAVNAKALGQVTGKFGALEVINSGSFPELDESTMDLIYETCRDKNIHTLTIECHWLYRKAIPALRERFAKIGVRVRLKQGVESFDADYRENVMVKGIKETDPSKIAEDYDECCVLFGLPGQTVEGMVSDVETGLENFERVCINVMVPNSAPLQPDDQVRKDFLKEVYPRYIDNPRVDILMENTEFGVGTPNEEE